MKEIRKIGVQNRGSDAGYVELLWHAYYEGVWNALFGRTGLSPAPQEGA